MISGSCERVIRADNADVECVALDRVGLSPWVGWGLLRKCNKEMW